MLKSIKVVEYIRHSISDIKQVIFTFRIYRRCNFSKARFFYKLINRKERQKNCLKKLNFQMDFFTKKRRITHFIQHSIHIKSMKSSKCSTNQLFNSLLVHLWFFDRIISLFMLHFLLLFCWRLNVNMSKWIETDTVLNYFTLRKWSLRWKGISLHE